MNKIISIQNFQSLDLYLEEIKKVPVNTPEQEVELAHRIKDNDEDAFIQFYNSNLRFVVSVAKLYLNRGKTFEELIEAGNSGLKVAARNFVPERGFKFISYAVYWIRKSIRRSIGEDTSNGKDDVTETDTQQEVIPLTKERVQQIRERALSRIRLSK